jgi:hypothetical protein
MLSSATGGPKPLLKNPQVLCRIKNEDVTPSSLVPPRPPPRPSNAQPMTDSWSKNVREFFDAELMAA